MFHVMLPVPDNLPPELRESDRWLVWKAERRGEKVAKIPCDRNGVTASMKEHHSSLADALRDARRLRAQPGGECYSVGYAFGEDCGIVALDLDGAIENGQQAEHLSWFIEQCPSWGEVSLSGNGAHLFYKGSFPGKRSIVLDGARIEVFGTRGFIAITGSRIPGTPLGLADFGPIGDVLIPFLTKQTNQKQTAEQVRIEGKYRAFGEAILKEDCEKILASVDGQKHYTLRDAAFHCGHFVPACYSLSEAENALRDAIARRGCDDMKLAWRTIHTGLLKGAEQPEYPPELYDGPEVDLSGWGKRQDEEEDGDTTLCISDPGPFPESLLQAPGFLGDVMNYTIASAYVPQPALALAGALSLLAVLTGRKVRDKVNTRTNLYVISVAGTGQGKEAARITNKEILFAAGADKLIGPEGLASHAGLISAVERQPACLFQLDEIGRIMATTNDAKRSPHLYSIITNLLKLYTSAGSIYYSDAYADAERNKSIVQPCAVVHGTTVPESLYAAFSEDSLSSGWLGRVLVFEAPAVRPAKQVPTATEPPKKVIEFAESWFKTQAGGNLSGEHPKPITLTTDDEAETVFAELDTYADDQSVKAGAVFGVLWSRAVEKARKLAMLWACSEGIGTEARITKAGAQWACELTDYLTRRLCWIASRHVASNTIEATSLKIERMIVDAGERGVSGVELLKRTRFLTKKDRQESILYLIDTGKIEQTQIRTGKPGRPTYIYNAVKH